MTPDSRSGRKSPVAQRREEWRWCVGIDACKARLDVHVLPQGQAFAVARDGMGLSDLVMRLQALASDLVAREATGGFEQVAAAALAGAGLPLVVVNPAQVRHFAKALGQRAKQRARSDPLILSRSKDRCRRDRPVRGRHPADGAAAAGCGHADAGL